MAIDNNIPSAVSASPALKCDGAAKKTRVIAFTSGKGGVGKTSLSVNLAIALARSGSKVCLFDADMGMANVNIMLGVTPAHTLEHLFTNEKSIQDILVTGPAGLDIVPGASGFSRCVDLDSEQQQRLVSALSYIEPKYDYLIIDTSAGISSTVLHFVAAAQMAAIVITPEPTSLTDAFSLLKVLRRRGYKRTPQVVVNMTQSAAKAEKIYRRFDAAVKKYIGLSTEYLGYVWMDESIRASVTLQRPVSLLPENDPSCKSFYRLADSLDNAYRRGNVPNISFTTYWEKVVERAAIKREEVSKRDDVPAASTPSTSAPSTSAPSTSTPITSTSSTSALSNVAASVEIPKIQVGMESELNKNVHPLHQSSEDQWIDLRIRLNQFLKNEDTTPEQVTTLLSSCIFSYGDQLGGAASDLLHGLFQVIDPAALSDEDRCLMTQNLEKLRLAPAENAEQIDIAGTRFAETSEVDKDSPDKSRPDKEHHEKVISEQPITAAQEASGSGLNDKEQEPSELALQKHQYDETGFGSQDLLIEKIRASKGQVSLEDLLESIKYASLVES